LLQHRLGVRQTPVDDRIENLVLGLVVSTRQPMPRLGEGNFLSPVQGALRYIATHTMPRKGGRVKHE
jgi:hypothetical protein